MSDSHRFDLNRADERQLTEHFRICDTAFVPPLSSRVDINDYAHKLVSKAQRFEAWVDDRLIGLLAMYCNAPDKRIAFITTVSVLPDWQGFGVASQLLGWSIDHAGELGFGCVELEVNVENHAALKLYNKHGLMKTGTGNSTTEGMALKIRTPEHPVVDEKGVNCG